jgi:hypothetical protein
MKYGHSICERQWGKGGFNYKTVVPKLCSPDYKGSSIYSQWSHRYI